MSTGSAAIWFQGVAVVHSVQSALVLPTCNSTLRFSPHLTTDTPAPLHSESSTYIKGAISGKHMKWELNDTMEDDGEAGEGSGREQLSEGMGKLKKERSGMSHPHDFPFDGDQRNARIIKNS